MRVSGNWRKRVAGITVLGLVLVGLTGCLFFIMALAPCKFRLQPGSLVAYDITTEIYPVFPDGSVAVRPSRTEARRVHLLCMSDANEVALVAPGRGGQRDEVTLLRFADNGSARCMDPALRLLPTGKALGFFDFNLLPLPEGLDQSWRCNVLYSLPPPGKRNVEGRVRRTANGLRPEFELELPTIEWIDERNGGRYFQISDLECDYAYDASGGIVDRAELTLRVGIEGDSAEYFKVRVLVQGEIVEQRQDTVALRDLALATARAQTALEDGRVRHLRNMLEDLRDRAGEDVGPVHDIARAIVAEQRRQSGAADGGEGWVVQVLSVSPGRQTHAEAVQRELVADGFPAFIRTDGERVRLLVGPYRERNGAIISELRSRFRAEQPIWKRL